MIPSFISILQKLMETNQRSQGRRSHGWERREGIRSDLVTPNPKLKLLDQVREEMRLTRGALRTLSAQKSSYLSIITP